jgi:NTP pyrophosphatase (non-canonical NTP hydrolase)
MNTIYGEADRARGVPRTALWLVSEVGELMRPLKAAGDSLVDAGVQANLREELADVFAWLCSLANLLGIDLETAALEKYPLHCPRCGNSECMCTRD